MCVKIAIRITGPDSGSVCPAAAICWLFALFLDLATTHIVSRPSRHNCSTDRPMRTISPGQSVLTASFVLTLHTRPTDWRRVAPRRLRGAFSLHLTPAHMGQISSLDRRRFSRQIGEGRGRPSEATQIWVTIQSLGGAC
jgi:hypothetical protein